MSYKILEARIEYKSGKLFRVTVLVDCTSSQSKPLSDVRAIFATTKPRPGYMFIMPDAQLNDSLLQKVASAGLETVDRDKIFPNWKRNLTNNNSSF